MILFIKNIYIVEYFNANTIAVTGSGRVCGDPVMQWRRPGAEFGGTKNYTYTELHFFRKKFPFSRQKFLTFFLVDQVFHILRFFTLLNVVYHLFFTRKPL